MSPSLASGRRELNNVRKIGRVCAVRIKAKAIESDTPGIKEQVI